MFNHKVKVGKKEKFTTLKQAINYVKNTGPSWFNRWDIIVTESIKEKVTIENNKYIRIRYRRK